MYDGEWAADRFHGSGTLSYIDGGEYVCFGLVAIVLLPCFLAVDLVSGSLLWFVVVE
jgi:hypothetical protein